MKNIKPYEKTGAEMSKVSKKCVSEECSLTLTGKLKLLPYQKNICKFIVNPLNRGILLFFDVGTGKTLTSIAAAKCLLDKYPNKKITVVTPSSLISNFEKELKKIKYDFIDKITIESYTIFSQRKRIFCQDTILILDEVHNLNGMQSIRFKKIFECAKDAFKVILLSATPVKNYPSEIANQLSLLEGKKISRGSIDAILATTNPLRKAKAFSKIFKCKIARFENTDKINFPVLSQKKIVLKMTPEYYREYYKVQENIRADIPDIFKNTMDLISFLNGTRRAVNTVGTMSPKIHWMIKKINDDLKNNKKILIYSAWIDSGIDIIKLILKDSGIPFGEISGRVSRASKDSDLEKYNKGEIKILLVTSSGAEGLNLKMTRTVIIMEPHWNHSRIDQVIGRAARYKSHVDLPVKDRNVTVYRLILEKPDKTLVGDYVKSADIIIDNLAENKQKDIDTFYMGLSAISIENDTSCF